jgi:hypothetical protein
VSVLHSAHLKWRTYRSERSLRTVGRFCFLPLLVLVNACGGTGTSEPKIPLGPSLLITNALVNDKVYVAWNDASDSRLSTDSVGPRVSNRCIRLRPVDADSAQWTLTATELVDGVRLTSTVTSYWFHPGDVRAAEVLVISSQQGSPNIMAWDSASAVNGPVFGQTREVPPHC